MTRFLNCVFQPKIQKGKAPEKVIHPYSRKAAYLAREESRLKRKERCVNNRRHARKTIKTVRITPSFVIYQILVLLQKYKNAFIIMYNIQNVLSLTLLNDIFYTAFIKIFFSVVQRIAGLNINNFLNRHILAGMSRLS